MSTEKLVIELATKLGNAEAEITTLKDRIDGLEQSTVNTDGAFTNLNKKTQTLQKGFKVMTGAVAAGSTALLAAARAASEYGKEISIASNRMGESVERTQELAFAANTVGISLEKLSDISKDTRERIGEFIATGGGAFQDFADVLGMTEEQAARTARQFQKMSGPQILQEMVAQMEEAGATAEEMSFALEGMASDTTDLIPLLSEGAAQLEELTKQARESTKILDEDDLKNIKNVQVELQTLANNALSVSSKITSVLSEDIVDIVETIGGTFELVGEGAIFLVNGIQIAVSTGIGAVMNLAREAQEAFLKLRIAWNELTGDDEEATFLRGALKDLQEFDARLDQFASDSLFESMGKLKEQLAEFREEGKEEGTTVVAALMGGTPDEVSEELDAYRAVTDDFIDGLLSDFAAMDREREKMSRMRERNERANGDALISLGKDIGNTLFEDSKLFNAGMVVADTAVGIQRALTPIVPGAPPNVFGAQIIAASGALQLANVLSARKGGGSISGGGVTAAPAAQQQQTNTVESGPTYYLENIDPTALFSGEQLIQILEEAEENGARLRLR